MRSAKQRQVVGVDGVHYTVTGTGEQTVVLLHGFCDNLTTWQRVIPRLAPRHRVIAIDLPGFGRSTRAWVRPLLAGYVDVVAEVLDAEGVTGPVSLIGNSMGGAVAALFAGQHPARTDRVVLIDMPGLRTVPRMWNVAMSRPAELGLRTALRVVPSGAAQYGLGWFYGRVASADPRRLDPIARAGFIGPYSVHDSVPAILPIGRALLAELRAARLGTLVGDLAAPVLLVFGARDLLTPSRVLRRLGRPGGSVVIPGCGHCPQLDQPDALLDEVAPFLSHDAVGVAVDATA